MIEKYTNHDKQLKKYDWKLFPIGIEYNLIQKNAIDAL